jgi:hypothetical protein
MNEKKIQSQDKNPRIDPENATGYGGYGSEENKVLSLE